MNVNEAKTLLLIYRPGTADAEDPQIAEALALTKSDTGLARWLEAHIAQQEALRAKFGQITAPAGLKEQIISEQAASRRRLATRQKLWVAAAAMLLLLGTLAILWFPRRPPDNSFTFYERAMVRTALGGYAMDLMTNTPVPIQAYLAENHAPADITLPAPLQHATLTGCAVRNWQGAKVSLICFRTGKPLPPGTSSDLWLFVVDRMAVMNAPNTTVPQFAKVNRLMTATWTEGDKLYLLGVEGQEADLRKYL